MADENIDNLEADLKRAESDKRLLAAAWVDLDKRRRRMRGWEQACSTIIFIGLLTLIHYGPPSTIEPAIFGMVIVGFLWWLSTRTRKIDSELERRYWQQRETDQQCEQIKRELLRIRKGEHPLPHRVKLGG